MKIGVYGSADDSIDNRIKELAKEVGRQIALNDHTLVTGACNGLPYEAVLGANEFNGKCIGYSPAIDEKMHIKRDKFPIFGFSEIIYLPENCEFANDKTLSRKYRDIRSVNAVDCGIIIGGQIGTLHEFTILHSLGKNIGVLENTGGLTEKVIYSIQETIKKDRGSKLVWEKDPYTLIKLLEVCELIK